VFALTKRFLQLQHKRILATTVIRGCGCSQASAVSSLAVAAVVVAALVDLAVAVVQALSLLLPAATN
jgi:hypothetical protein